MPEVSDSVLLFIVLDLVNALKLEALADALLSFRVSIVMSAIYLISISVPSLAFWRLIDFRRLKPDLTSVKSLISSLRFASSASCRI